MEMFENRHISDSQAATSEGMVADNPLSLADLYKRNLERAMACNVDIAHIARSQKLPPEKLIKFLIAAEGGPLAKELHRAGIERYPRRRVSAPPSNPARCVPQGVFGLYIFQRIRTAQSRLQGLSCLGL